jgi:hypothetical protein
MSTERREGGERRHKDKGEDRVTLWITLLSICFFWPFSSN